MSTPGRFKPVQVTNDGLPLGVDRDASLCWFGTFVPLDQDFKDDEFIGEGHKRWDDVTRWGRVEEIDYIVGKWEKAKTLHFHFFVKFYKRLSQNTARRLLGLSGTQYLKPADTAQRSIDYVCKSFTAVSDVWEYGSFVGQGHRSDLESVADHIKRTGCSEQEIAQLFTHIYMRNHYAISRTVRMFEQYDRTQPPLCIILHGTTGGGKTYMTSKFDSNRNTYRKTMQGKWWDGYIGERTVCLDDFDPNELMDPVSHTIILKEMLCAMDGYSDTRIQNKGGSALLRHETLFISSNFDVRDWFPHHEQKKAFMRRIHFVLKFTKGWEPGMTRPAFKIEKADITDGGRCKMKLTTEQVRWFQEFVEGSRKILITDEEGYHHIREIPEVAPLTGTVSRAAQAQIQLNINHATETLNRMRIGETHLTWPYRQVREEVDSKAVTPPPEEEKD